MPRWLLVALLAAVSVGAAVAGAARSPDAVGRALETITVANTSAKAVSSSTVLERGFRYRLVARGTVSDWCTATNCPPGNPGDVAQPNVGVDALYCYAKWRCGATPQLWRQLRVNGKGLDEFAGVAGKLPYSAGHVYAVVACGTGGKLSLVSSDAAAGSAGDNSGSFTVEISKAGSDAGCAGKGPVPPPRPPAAKVDSAVGWADDQRGSRKWAGRCERFVESAYGARTGYRTANDAAQRIGLRTGSATDVPTGALIYFRPNCPGTTGEAGHVGISIGGGKMISPLGQVAITDLRTNARWRSAYSGWTYPPPSWPGR